MKKSIYLVSVAMMAVLSLTLASCGGDDDDNVLNKTTTGSQTAVHKIKFSVTGNVDKFKWTVSFRGTTWDGNVASMATIYDAKGNAIDEYVENIPDMSGETNKYGATLVAAVLVTDYDASNTDQISFKFEGFINGKLTNAKTFDIQGNGAGGHAFSFSTIPLD